MILDPRMEDRCDKVWDELGIDSDHSFDTEVCQEFESLLRDKLFTVIDNILESLDVPKFQPITYVDIK